MVSYMKSACPVKLYRFSVFRVDVSFVLAWTRLPGGEIERLRFTFTPNGKREFVPRDQVFPSFSLIVYYFYSKVSSFTPMLSIRIVLDSFCLLIFFSEKSVWNSISRLPERWLLISEKRRETAKKIRLAKRADQWTGHSPDFGSARGIFFFAFFSTAESGPRLVLFKLLHLT